MITWKLWARVPTVALWEAVALVLDIEPRSLEPSANGWMAGPGRGPFFTPRSFPSEAKRADFDKALSFAERAANAAGPIYLRTGLAVGMNKRTAQVSLAEVVAYFIGCDWPDIPAPLLALVSAAADMTAPPVVPVPTVAESVTRTHELKRRGDALAAVLALAKKQALAADDWQSVWASLVALAQSAKRPAPLLGYSEGEGVKYQTDNDEKPVGWLTREAYRGRFKRQS